MNILGELGWSSSDDTMISKGERSKLRRPGSKESAGRKLAVCLPPNVDRTWDDRYGSGPGNRVHSLSIVAPEVRHAIHDLLCEFFLAFDQRDWVSMRHTLAETVFVDYSSSGREAPVTMPGTEFVERRKGAVDSLSKQHSF